MNTIFVDLGKQFLIDAIMQSCTNSVLADNSVFNKGLGLVGLQRNAQLAADKRACLESLRRELADYNPGLEIVDSAALEQFIKLLMKHRTTSNQLSKDKGLPEGATGNSLLKAIALIQAIYDQLNISVNRPTSCKLLNVPKDQEALHIFKYFVAKYFTMKIISQQGLSLMQEVTEQPQISTFRARALEREALITAAINECEDSLSGLKQKHRRCQEWTIRHVTTCIKTLQTQDNDLCARYGSILNATTNLLSYVGLAQADDNLLSNLMKEALVQIANITLGTVTEEDLGWDDEKDEIDCNEVKRATTAVTVASAPNEQEEEEDEEDEDAFMASAHSLSSQ